MKDTEPKNTHLHKNARTHTHTYRHNSHTPFELIEMDGANAHEQQHKK